MTTHVCVEQIAVAPDFFLGLAVHDGCGSAVQLPVPDWSQRTGHRWTSTTNVRLTAPVLSAISARAARRKVEHKIIRVSRYQKGDADLDFTEARDSEWQWHELMGRMQVCTLLQTDNHASTPPLYFYRPGALPADQPTACKHWRQTLNVNNQLNRGFIFVSIRSNVSLNREFTFASVAILLWPVPPVHVYHFSLRHPVYATFKVNCVNMQFPGRPVPRSSDAFS